MASGHSLEAGAGIQKQVNKVFSEEGKGDAKPFREFQDDSTRKLSMLLQNFVAVGIENSSHEWLHDGEPTTDQKGLEAVVEYALTSITEQNLNPVLVKLTLAIYLTHSEVAHSLGVVAPTLKEHSEFKTTAASNPVTGDTLKGFELLAYFREDYDFNDHHYHWHLVYPYGGIPEPGQKHHRTIERQGELFLYMHSQMIARYNSELLSWGLDMDHAWSYDDILTFGYTPVPGLRDTYGARPPYQGWYENHSHNLTEEEAKGFPPKRNLVRWRNNINKAIIDGFFYTKIGEKSGKLKLTPENAINWVGVVVEAENPDLQEVSPGSGEYINRDLYGNLHNLGHNKFAEIGYKEYTSKNNELGVMISNVGSPRDPCFWLWHRHIDDFRNTLVKKYTHNINEFNPNVKINSLEIKKRDPESKTPVGGVATFLGPPRLDHNEANAKIDHEPYQWKVVIESIRNPPPTEDDPQTFTVRIFIAPEILIQDQRAWIEMDKFSHTLTDLTDTLIRLDTQSSVARKTPKPGEKLGSRCLCGWPQNMMLPNGTPEGTKFVGFAILTDDKMADGKTQALSFCGGSDKKYPDPRGMGYPFNKTWSSRVQSTLSVPEIIATLPQVKLCEFKIYRYTQLHQGSKTTPHPPSNVTWENTIKDFFRQQDIDCMKKYFDLGKKADVALHASQIYQQVKDGSMPQDGPRWSSERVAQFEAWIQAGKP